MSVCRSMNPLFEAALYRSTLIRHTLQLCAKRELVGARPLHLACARPFSRLKAPLGLSLLRFAAQTRTTLFLLCTKSCIVWRKIGVWRSFCWKSAKRKSLKLLVVSRSFRLCYLKIGIYCSIGFIVGIGQGRLTNGFISLYKTIHAASFFLLPYVTLRNSPQLTGNLV